MKILGKSFQENFNHGQNVSVDDAIVKGKGRNPVKQYMPAKPIKAVVHWLLLLCIPVGFPIVCR